MDDTMRLRIKGTYDEALSRMDYFKRFINKTLINYLDKALEKVREIENEACLSSMDFRKLIDDVASAKMVVLQVQERVFNKMHDIEYFRDGDGEYKSIQEIYRAISCMQSLSECYDDEIDRAEVIIEDNSTLEYVVDTLSLLISSNNDILDMFESELDVVVANIMDEREDMVNSIDLAQKPDVIFKKLSDIGIYAMPDIDSVKSAAVEYTAMLFVCS